MFRIYILGEILSMPFYSKNRGKIFIFSIGLFAEYVPVCPEVECVMPIPRQAVRLVGSPENPRLLTQKTGEDKTRQMKDWMGGRLKELATKDLCGFIFRSKSPSSGLYRIRVYGDDNKVRKNGTRLFAKAFTQTFPRIPVEEAGRLHDPKLRENFIESIFSLQRWRYLLEQNRTLGGLVDFHTHNKLLILSHSQAIYRTVGQLVATGKTMDLDELFDRYEQHLLKALKLNTTLKKNINVLQHMMGYFKKKSGQRRKTGTAGCF